MTAVTYRTSAGEERSRLLPSTLAGAFVVYLKGAGATQIRTEVDHD